MLMSAISISNLPRSIMIGDIADRKLERDIAEREQGDEGGAHLGGEAGAQGVDGQQTHARGLDRAMQQAGEGGDRRDQHEAEDGDGGGRLEFWARRRCRG